MATNSPFSPLGLRDSLVQTLEGLGYESPTPIQEKTIPLLLAGRDVIGQAQTGTGKTAAFALPILEKIDPTNLDTQALVLTPTRELAMQVAEAVHSYAHGMPQVVVLPVYGGAPIVHQLKRLQRGVQIVVGTPGRLIDHLDRGSLKLGSVRLLVVDEADEMLKMGFLEDVEKILAAAPPSRQIALFSATMPAAVVRIAERHMTDAERVQIEHKSVAAPAIEQRFLNVSEGQKLEVLTQILELEESEATLIFRRTKNGAAELAERLQGRGFAAVAMHGDMKQAERENVIRRLRSGAIEIVVATDVAARGLDVDQIEHVINYDIPNDVEAYVHRIGRTGRAGRSGSATLFVTPRERRMMRDIERFTKTSIKPLKMPTRADIAARRMGLLKETVRKAIGEGDLDLYLQLVEQLVEEGPHDIAEVAAAAAKLASQGRPLAEQQIAAPRAIDEATAAAQEKQAFARSRSPRETATARFPGRTAAAASTEARVKLSMALGKADGIRPADVVGSIANEADIPGRDIGPIEIGDSVTFVMVPASAAEQIVARLSHARFRGRPVNVRLAGAGADRTERPDARRRGEDRAAGPARKPYGRATDRAPSRGRQTEGPYKSAKPRSKSSPTKNDRVPRRPAPPGGKGSRRK